MKFRQSSKVSPSLRKPGWMDSQASTKKSFTCLGFSAIFKFLQRLAAVHRQSSNSLLSSVSLASSISSSITCDYIAMVLPNGDEKQILPMASTAVFTKYRYLCLSTRIITSKVPNSISSSQYLSPKLMLVSAHCAYSCSCLNTYWSINLCKITMAYDSRSSYMMSSL